MVKIEYYVREMRVNQKTQEVAVMFRRLPTQEELNKFEAHLKDQEDHPQPVEFKGMGFMSIVSLFEDNQRERQIELNFNNVQFILTLNEVIDLELRIAQRVRLDIPETGQDIVI